MKKFQGSLEPPLSSSYFRSTTTVSGSGRSLVAQTSSDSNVTNGLQNEDHTVSVDDVAAEDVSREAGTEIATTEKSASVNEEGGANTFEGSSATLSSMGEGESTENQAEGEAALDGANLQPDSPSRKTDKKRFESGTASTPGRSHF